MRVISFSYLFYIYEVILLIFYIFVQAISVSYHIKPLENNKIVIIKNLIIKYLVHEDRVHGCNEARLCHLIKIMSWCSIVCACKEERRVQVVW